MPKASDTGLQAGGVVFSRQGEVECGRLVGHVHVTDVPGRHEPGTGTIDWPLQLSALRSAGYSGALGLEYRPARDTWSSLQLIRRLHA